MTAQTDASDADKGAGPPGGQGGAVALSQLHAAWKKQGKAAISEFASEHPEAFLAAIVALVIPKKRKRAKR